MLNSRFFRRRKGSGHSQNAKAHVDCEILAFLGGESAGPIFLGYYVKPGDVGQGTFPVGSQLIPIAEPLAARTGLHRLPLGHLETSRVKKRKRGLIVGEHLEKISLADEVELGPQGFGYFLGFVCGFFPQFFL